jgi:hypothetical protein
MAAGTRLEWKCNVCDRTMDETSKQSHLAGKAHVKKTKASKFSAENGTGKAIPEQPRYAFTTFMECLQIVTVPIV